MDNDLVVGIKDIDLSDKRTMGESLASLGELSQHEVVVLPKIIITPMAFSAFLQENNLTTQIKHLLGSINHDRHDSLSQVSKYIQSLILHAKIPKEIYDPVFKKVEKMGAKKMDLEAYYFHGVRLVGSEKWEELTGEHVLIEQIRFAWAELFSLTSLKKHLMHHTNFHMFSSCLTIAPEYEFLLNGRVSTMGESKNEYEIEAYEMVKFVYNKHNSRLEKGHILPGGNKDALSPHDIKILLDYAKAAEKALFLPYVLFWGNHDGTFLIKRVLPATDVGMHSDTYSTLIENVTVNPGITIGKLKVIDEKSKTELIVNDEIVKLKKLDKDMLETIKTAKGIIIEEEPHPEILHLLKSF
jgi:phosphoenolpyruvate synthase/pyruvate phosphate dikinase